jgi:hypothetical protein
VGTAAIFGCKTYDDNEDPRLHAEYWCTTISGSVSRSHFGVQEAYRQPVTIPFVLHCLWKEIGSERSGVFQQAWIGPLREQMGGIEFCTRAIRATLAFPWCGQNEKLSLFEL